MVQSRAIEAINRTQAAESGGYIQTNLNLEQGLVGGTFGTIMRNIHDAVFGGVGLDMNISNAYADIMNPNNAIPIKGRTYYPHSSVGNLHPYNSDGNFSSGCFSLYTMV